MKHVVVVGGGIIGLSTAFALKQRGVPEVTIIEEGSGPHGASVVNAGWVTPAHSDPVPAPGLVRKSMRWMMRSDSPLYIKPGAMVDPAFARWMYQFWRACNARNFKHAIDSMGELNRTTFPLFDAYAAAGIEFEMYTAGLFCAFMSARNLEHELEHLEMYKAFGLQIPEPLWGKDARDAEPALSENVNGAFLVSTERHIRPQSLTDGLLKWLSENNVTLRTQSSVVALTIENDRCTAVETSTGRVPADAVVIAAGARSSTITKMAGITLPLQGGKGYSIDYASSPTKPVHPMSLYEARMAVTPTSTFTRLAGTMELSGINTVVRKERVAALARGAGQFLRGWSGEVGSGVVGSGLRPMTPDGMPIIGMIPGMKNVSVSTGHQMLGLTLAPASGDALAEALVTGKMPDVLKPFSVTRFS